MKIREYDETDYAELVDMIMSLYSDDPEGEAMNHNKIGKTIEVLKSNPCKGSIMILEDMARVVGYGLLINQWSNEFSCHIINIDELYVKPDDRSKGYGTMFINQVIEKNETSVIALEVTPSNKRVRAYYEKLGFRIDDNNHLIYGI